MPDLWLHLHGILLVTEVHVCKQLAYQRDDRESNPRATSHKSNAVTITSTTSFQGKQDTGRWQNQTATFQRKFSI